MAKRSLHPTGIACRYEKLYIDGEWVDPADGEIVESIDPATGEPWATVAFGGIEDVDHAVAAANQALPAWKRTPGGERAAILRNVAELFEKRLPELTVLEARDTGATITEMQRYLAAQPTSYLWYASLADKLGGRTIPMDPTVHIFTTREPVGVVGAITPWNAPLQSACWKAGPALAAGCTLVLKPARYTSLTSLVLGEIMQEAGVPPGVFNVVPGRGQTVGAHLVSHRDVAKIAFTGEGSTAQEMMKRGADTMKRFTFELGGKSPHIVFEDADLSQAVNAVAGSGFALCGQSCALGSRVLVQQSIYDQVAEELVRRAKRIRVGLPLDKTTQMGPQAHEDQLNKTLNYVQIGINEGAKLLTGGMRITDGGLGNGNFVAPTVFADVDNKMRIAQEEIFGPVIAMIPFKDEEEAVSIANDTRYGLTAGLWTRDVSRAHRVSAQIEAGMVWVNTYRYIRWTTPYGGFKMSGLGRENGLEAMDNYLETRTTVISTTGQYADPYAD